MGEYFRTFAQGTIEQFMVHPALLEKILANETEKHMKRGWSVFCCRDNVVWTIMSFLRSLYSGVFWSEVHFDVSGEDSYYPLRQEVKAELKDYHLPRSFQAAKQDISKHEVLQFKWISTASKKMRREIYEEFWTSKILQKSSWNC